MQKKIIKIEIKDKIAQAVDKKCFIVCGNDDYEIEFAFDEEWAGVEAKTAYFIANGVTLPPVPFKGNKCPVPKLSNTTALSVGVSAGDLKTTTDAVISCRKSIRCKCGAPVPPKQDVYDRIMQMINDGMLRGERGDKGEKGDKGDAGSIKFIPVAELPTENIDDSAIYLLPVADSTEENRFTEYVYIDGKWETIGAITVQVDHSEYVKVTDYATASKAGVVRARNDFGISSVYVDGNGTLSTICATEAELKSKTSPYKPIVPSNSDKAWKISATSNTEEWTDDDKAAACKLLGALKPVLPTGSGLFLVTITKDGTAYWQKMSTAVSNNSVPISNSKGNIKTNTPEDPKDCTNKEYVDGLIAELRAAIEALKG